MVLKGPKMFSVAMEHYVMNMHTYYLPGNASMLIVMTVLLGCLSIIIRVLSPYFVI